MLMQEILETARKKLVTIDQTASLIDAARLLGHKEANLIVVCDAKGAVAGVISKTDIVRRIGTCQGSNCTSPVASAMTRDVLTCHRDDPFKNVWDSMKSHGFKHIPVVDDDLRPIGLVTARDVLARMIDDVEYEEQLLRDYVMRVGYH